MIKFLKLLSVFGMIVTSSSTIASYPATAVNQLQHDLPQLSLQTFQTIKKDLQEDLKNTNLGSFVNVPDVKDILLRVKEKNPNLDTTQVGVMGITEDQIVLYVIKDSQIYNSGIIALTYRIKPDQDLPELKDILIETNLGQFSSTPTEEEILTRLEELNPNLDIAQVLVLKIDLDSENVLLGVVPGSPVYKAGDVLLEFNIVPVELPKLSDVITRYDLGEFQTVPTIAQILIRIKELNPRLDVGQIMVISHRGQQVIIRVIPGSTIYQQGELTLTYLLIPPALPSISDVIKNVNLGLFSSIPTETEILARLKELNPNLDVSQITVSKIEEEQISIRVIDRSTIYRQGEMFLTYTIRNNLIALTDIVKVTNLGKFAGTPTVEEILARVKALNSRLDVSQVSIALLDFNQAVIRVKDNSTVYEQGGLILNYQISTRLKLKDVLQVTNLGQFGSTPTVEQILKRLKELNSSVDTNELMVININPNNHQILIRVSPDSLVYEPGEVILNYQISTRLKLKDVLQVTNLGQFGWNAY